MTESNDSAAINVYVSYDGTHLVWRLGGGDWKTIERDHMMVLFQDPPILMRIQNEDPKLSMTCALGEAPGGPLPIEITELLDNQAITFWCSPSSTQQVSGRGSISTGYVSTGRNHRPEGTGAS